MEEADHATRSDPSSREMIIVISESEIHWTSQARTVFAYDIIWAKGSLPPPLMMMLRR